MTASAGGVSCRMTIEVGESRVIRAENDNGEVIPEGGNTSLFRPSWTALVLPTAVIAAGYAVAFAVLQVLGRGDGALARLCIIVLALGVPLLLASAMLRYFTIQVQLLSDTIIVHRGFPRRDEREIAYSLIRAVDVSKGIAGNLTDSGTLTFELVTGQRFAIADLAGPNRIKSALDLQLDGRSESGERERVAIVQ